MHTRLTEFEQTVNVSTFHDYQSCGDFNFFHRFSYSHFDTLIIIPACDIVSSGFVVVTT